MKAEVYQNNNENPSVCHRKHSMSIAKAEWLILFTKVIAVFLTVIKKHMNMPWDKMQSYRRQCK
jgi:hypothetical protein